MPSGLPCPSNTRRSNTVKPPKRKIIAVEEPYLALALIFLGMSKIGVTTLEGEREILKIPLDPWSIYGQFEP
jgi:hypothetical protein